jgi:hypothetical protein
MTADHEFCLAHHFAGLTDPRVDRSRLHELLDIVAIAIWGFLHIPPKRYIPDPAPS